MTLPPSPTSSGIAGKTGDSRVASASVRPEPSSVEADVVLALPAIARVIEEWLFGGASDEETARHVLRIVPPVAMQAMRHLRVAQVIYDDSPDDSDKAQADLHMSAAILLAKRLVPYGDTRVSDAEAHEVINSAPRAHLTGGRNV